MNNLDLSMRAIALQISWRNKILEALQTEKYLLETLLKHHGLQLGDVIEIERQGAPSVQRRLCIYKIELEFRALHYCNLERVNPGATPRLKMTGTIVTRRGRLHQKRHELMVKSDQPFTIIGRFNLSGYGNRPTGCMIWNETEEGAE